MLQKCTTGCDQCGKMLANMSVGCGANIKHAGGYSEVQFGFENIKYCYNCELLSQSCKYAVIRMLEQN